VDGPPLDQTAAAGIADGWKQFLTLPNAEVLAMSQLRLSLIHQAHTLLEPSTRSYLYAGAYGLVGLALHQREHYEEALHAYHNGHLAALATGDPWYVAQSLICQADAYLGLGMYAEALHAIEEGLLGLGESDEMHRRARAHLLGYWADVAMTMRNFGETPFERNAVSTVAVHHDHTPNEDAPLVDRDRSGLLYRRFRAGLTIDHTAILPRKALRPAR
jgi:tetratricopeptide (TPR) repeat protein